MRVRFHYSLIQLFFILLAGSVCAKASEDFRWITQERDPELWAVVKNAFGPELQPDDPKKLPERVAPSLHKRLDRVGIYKASCLVFVGHGYDAEFDPLYDDTGVYNYNLDTKAKTEIQITGAGFALKIAALANFESSESPDIVFETQNCVECESTGYLMSLRYDPQSERWILREWPTERSWVSPQPSTGILMDTVTEDFCSACVCLYAIKDFTGDGYDDIALRCKQSRFRFTPGRKEKSFDENLLYKVTTGVAKKVKVTDNDLIQQIKQAVCKGKKNEPLCK